MSSYGGGHVALAWKIERCLNIHKGALTPLALRSRVCPKTCLNLKTRQVTEALPQDPYMVCMYIAGSGQVTRRSWHAAFNQGRWWRTRAKNVAAATSPLRQWCGWNSNQHQTWRRPLRSEFVQASIPCWIELYCFGVRRYFWKCTNKCVAQLQTLGGKNSSVFNACNSGLMLGGKFKKGDAGWKVSGCWVEIAWENTKTVKIAKA